MLKVRKFLKKGMDGEYQHSLAVCLNPEDNGGEHVELSLDVFKNDDGDVYTNVHIEANCYGAHATTVCFWGITLDRIAQAATMLDKECNKKES